MDTTTTTTATDDRGELSCLDGPGLCAWIDEEEGGELKNAELRLGYHARRVRGWREGDQARVYVADAVLTKLSLHLGHVPAHLYVPPNNQREKPPEVRAEIVRRVIRDGESIKAVARSLGCDRKTVQRYLRLHEEGLQAAS